MQRTSILTIAAVLLMGGAAAAQNPPAQSGPNNKAINSSDQNNSDKPVAGRNSFTEGQAKSKIEDAGYTNVGELKKDDNGVWRGKASKGGSSTNVSVDFQGNVNPAK
jgi:opacity protein-like surface antigen